MPVPPRNRSGAWAAFSEKQDRYLQILERLKTSAALEESLKPAICDLEEGFKDLLTTDPMTGCLNRGSLEQTLAASGDSSGRIRGPYAMMLLDVDHFKQINDLYGHREGDRCLVELAELLLEATREEDSLFRLGGDEFLLVLPGLNTRQVREKAEALREKIKAGLRLPEYGTLPFTVSIGILVLGTGEIAPSPAEILEHVDQALYSSKHSGRDRSTLWTPYLPNETLPADSLSKEDDPISLRIERDHAREFSVEIMSAILDAREFETSLHSERVTRITAFLLEKMGIPEPARHGILQGARLHDIGKVAIPEHILHKQEQLTESERHILERHPEIGFRFVATCSFLREASEVILHHHERWDGKGYPHGLSATEIPLSARIFSVVDTYDSMRANRVYRESIPLQTAIEELRSHSGTQFDPAVVRVVLEHIQEIEAIGHWQE